MAEDAKPGNGGTPGADATPSMQIVAQYVRDLSFENPGIGQQVRQPNIDLNVDLQARRAAENANQFEVLLTLRITASENSKTLFLLELVYGGVFMLSNIPDDAIQPMLLIECPRLLFPFARRIIADVVRDGGLPPLMVEPIDFAGLYRAKMAEAAAGRTPGQAPS